MEPMTLGSNPSSPASPVVNPNFLPGFLMGGEIQPSTPNPSTSPGRNRNSGNFGKPRLSEGTTLRQKLFNQSLAESPAPLSPFAPVPEKPGPPKMGLFDTLDQKKKPGTPLLSSTVAQMNESVGFNESISRITEDNSLNYTRNVQFNETVNRGLNMNSNRIDSYWITVFGFPPSALTLVLTQLANCGPIAEKRIPSQGNWIHVKFNNLSEVARALSLNGKLISNSIMIGVNLHYENDDKENDGSAIFTSPIRARSLRHSFVSPQSPNSVIPPQALPQKSTGLVTKAMEYVFGW